MPSLKYERGGIANKERASIEEENRPMSVNYRTLNIRFFAAVLYRDIIIHLPAFRRTEFTWAEKRAHCSTVAYYQFIKVSRTL